MGFQRRWSNAILILWESLSMHRMKMYRDKGSPRRIPLGEEKDGVALLLKRMDIVGVQIHDTMSLIIFKERLKNKSMSCIKDHSRRIKAFSKSTVSIKYLFQTLVFFKKKVQQFLHHQCIIKTPLPSKTLDWLGPMRSCGNSLIRLTKIFVIP